MGVRVTFVAFKLGFEAAAWSPDGRLQGQALGVSAPCGAQASERIHKRKPAVSQWPGWWEMTTARAWRAPSLLLTDHLVGGDMWLLTELSQAMWAFVVGGG